MAVRRWSSARAAARACGVGAFVFLADAERRIELRRSRDVVLPSGVWTAERRVEDLREGGSALTARREGVVAVDNLDLFVPPLGVVDFLDGEDIMTMSAGQSGRTEYLDRLLGNSS
jgi:hypothetical protein